MIRLAAIQRLLWWYGLNEYLNLVLVTEFPKSGGSWLCAMLADILNIPFPRNVAPKFESSIMHGHFLYHRQFGRTIGLIRDGRDVMVSAYYYFLFENERNGYAFVQNNRKLLAFDDYNNIEDNLPRFIEYMFTEYAKGTFKFTWSECIQSFYTNSNVHIVKYENLLVRPRTELEGILEFLNLTPSGGEGIDEVITFHSFTETKRRQSDQFEMSFLRSGKAGDWRNCFTDEAKNIFNYFAGEALLRAGYELNNNWVHADTRA